jgi:hypothetical protein
VTGPVFSTPYEGKTRDMATEQGNPAQGRINQEFVDAGQPDNRN